jgi:hypothetical protein
MLCYTNDSNASELIEAARADHLIHIDWTGYDDQAGEPLGVVYAETPEFVENYRRSGGLWAYAD